MKKTLALVLALVMVLALVPAAFAGTYTFASTDSYKVVLSLKQSDIGSMDQVFGTPAANGYYTFSATGAAPEVKLDIPYSAIAKSAGASVWDGQVANMWVDVIGFGGTDTIFAPGKTYGNNIKVVVNNEDVTSKVKAFTYENSTIGFNIQDVKTDTNTFYYVITVSGTSSDGKDTASETMHFTIAYQNTTKPVYALKFNQPATTGVELKDGVYFIDSATDTFSTMPSFDVNVAKNDGSKFTEVAYYSEVEAVDGQYKYPKVNTNYGGTPTSAGGQVTSQSRITITGLQYYLEKALDVDEHADTVTKTYYVNVETKYAFYQGTITYKFRKNIQRVDPKGIDFAKSEYTIGVNEVLKPTYNTVVPVWHDVASFVTLSTSTNSEKGIIDVDNVNHTITGLREGTVYLTAEYGDAEVIGLDNKLTPKYYTDTVKVTVKGTYQVTDKANYVVTTKSGNLNVREKPSTSAKKIGSVAKGTVVEVVEIKDGWAKIVSTAYTNGYVSAQYLTKQGTKPETVVGTKTVIARVLNVRSGAGTSYSIVGKLTRNTKVEVIETVASGKWAKIKFNDSYAYVSCTYLQ